MSSLRGVAALLACSLLLPVAAPCAAWATSSSPLPCCASPAKGGGCEAPAVASMGAGCCSTAPADAQRLPAGIDRAAALDLPAGTLAPAATAHALRPDESAHCATRPDAQHDILRL